MTLRDRQALDYAKEQRNFSAFAFIVHSLREAVRPRSMEEELAMWKEIAVEQAVYKNGMLEAAKSRIKELEARLIEVAADGRKPPAKESP